jgi:hypothetical protein
MPSVGSNSVSAKLSGIWKSWSNFWAKHNGVWKKPLGVYVKTGGSWVKVWDERPVFSNVTTSYYIETADIVPIVYYYKNFTISANGFQTNLTSNDPTGYGVSFSQTTVNADTSVYVTTTTSQIGGEYNPANYPTITATNASGVSTA